MFYYTNDFQNQADNVKSVIINHSIQDLNELFELFQISLQIPYSTMTNFAAFRDVMTELDWIHEGEIRIYHEILPSLDEESLGCYIDVLNLVDVEWRKYEEQADIVKDFIKQSGKVISKDAWIHKRPKIFNVFFKNKDEYFIKKLLKQYSKNYQICIHYDKKGLESWK
ncbi:MAG: hypothetical protein J6M37_05545 [Prevotella sp.]|nr:hypothetical protein [Prevotella sp.]